MFAVVKQLNTGHRIQYRNISHMINARAAWVANKRHDQFAKARAWLSQS